MSNSYIERQQNRRWFLGVRIFLLCAVFFCGIGIMQTLTQRQAAAPEKIADFIQASYLMALEQGGRLDLKYAVARSCSQPGAVPDCQQQVQEILAERSLSMPPFQPD